jgi:transposase
MRENDGRKLNREAQAQIRIRSVQMVLDGESPEDVVKSIGYQRTMIYVRLAKYRYGGFDALKVHKSNGRPPKLSAQRPKHVACRQNAEARGEVFKKGLSFHKKDGKKV